MKFPNNLRRMLVSKKIKQVEFCEMLRQEGLNMYPSKLHGYISEQYQPKLETLKAMAKVLDMEVDQLIK